MPNKLPQTECEDILLSLQHGDSFFPSGAIAVSAGLETMVNEDRVRSSNDVAMFLHGQLKYRWAVFDRQVLVATYRAMDNLPQIAGIDALVEAQTLAAESRAGSKCIGRALLGVHTKLATDYASEYQGMVNNAVAHGHNTVVQGLVWNATGISESAAELLSAHTLCVGVAGAALRLGVIGHIDAQKIIASAHTIIQQIRRHPIAGLEELCSFTPEQEIAVMRHEAMPYRLFIN